MSTKKCNLLLYYYIYIYIIYIYINVYIKIISKNYYKKIWKNIYIYLCISLLTFHQKNNIHRYAPLDAHNA